MIWSRMAGIARRGYRIEAEVDGQQVERHAFRVTAGKKCSA